MRAASRRPKLRIRVLAGVLVITLAALAAFDVIAITSLHRYLIRQSGERLQAALTVTQPKVSIIMKARQAFPVPGAYTIVLVPHTPAGTRQARPVVLEYGRPGVAAVAGYTAVAMAGRPATVTVIRARTELQLATIQVPAGTLVAGTSLRGVNAAVSRFRLIVIAGSAAAGLAMCGGVLLVSRRARASVAERDATAAAMHRFFADASHELRTPLASLRANAELYQQGALVCQPALDEVMQRIAAEARRMSRLVDDMLHLARLDQLTEPGHEPVDLRQLAGDCVADARRADPSRRYLCDAELCPADPASQEQDLIMCGDGELLRRALDNLLANVRTHTPPGTTASMLLRGTGDAIIIEVSDDGPGIAPDELPRIFDRFYRASAPVRRPGSGLGLAIVAEVAAAHGGAARATANHPHGLSIGVTVRAPARQPSKS